MNPLLKFPSMLCATTMMAKIFFRLPLMFKRENSKSKITSDYLQIQNTVCILQCTAMLLFFAFCSFFCCWSDVKSGISNLC
jgi:hypothetical protein